MENGPHLGDSSQDSGRRKTIEPSLLARPRHIDTPYPEVMEEQAPSLLIEYWDILRRHRGALVLSAFLGFLAALLFTLPQTPVYRARASLEIQNLNENFLNMGNVNPTTDASGSNSPEDDLQTQVKILQSDSVLNGVVAKLNLQKRLGLEKNRGRLAALRATLGLPGPKPRSPQEEALQVVTRNLKVQTETSTRLIEIFYDSTNPKLAADFVNALTAEFIKQNLEARWKTSQQTGEWLTAQMDVVRNRFEKSEDELQKYASASGLLFTSENDNVAEDKLRQLQADLSRAHADRVASQSKYELAETTSPDSLPEVLDDKTLENYQVKLTDLRRQRAELLSTLTRAHPKVKKVQAQTAAMESALEKGRADVIQRIRNEYESAQLHENLLAQNYASQARLVSEQAAKVAHYNILKREVDSNRQLYDSLLRNVQKATMTAALRASNVRVVDPATTPSSPYRPSLVLNAALGLLAGLFFGMAFVVVRERVDRSIQAPGEASLSLGLPELGVIPSADAEGSRYFAYYDTKMIIEGARAANGKGPKLVELVTWQRKPSVLADCFRATLTSILYCGENGDQPRIVALTSAGPQEGKTTVACNLALALVEIGWSVLLIDGDLRKGRLHEIFKVPNASGLTDILAGNKGTIIPTGCGGLWLLPAGTPASFNRGLLYSPRMLETLTFVRAKFHAVIIDTPPMLHMPDARVLGKLADGVVLVVRSAQTTKGAAAATAERLREDGSRVLGTILNEWDPRKTRPPSYAHGQWHYSANGA